MYPENCLRTGADVMFRLDCFVHKMEDLLNKIFFYLSLNFSLGYAVYKFISTKRVAYEPFISDANKNVMLQHEKSFNKSCFLIAWLDRMSRKYFH